MTDYTAYADWKSWAPVDFMRPTKTERSYYAREFRRCDLKGKNVLEIGFGNGSFLGWAKEQGARVYGTEIQPELKKRAEAAYVAVESSALSELLPHRTKFFHVIVALDVFEHISIEQLPGLLMVISELLADDGLLVARYPNGQSPFGRTYQYGDITHVTVLSAGIMMQLVENLPFAIVHLGNPARPSGAIHVIRALLQRAIEIALHGIYLFRGPIAPNSVAVLRRLPRRVS